MQDIDIYYDSIRQVYEQILKQRKKTLPKRIRSFSIYAPLFVLSISVIPIIPIIIAFMSGQTTLVGFLIIYVISLLLTIAIAFANIWLWSKRAKHEKSNTSTQTLSPEQMSFVLAYEAYRELKFFFVSHVDQHVARSWEAIDKLMYPYFHFGDTGDLFEGFAEREKSTPNFREQIRRAQEFLQSFSQYSWFQLDTDNKAALQALASFPDKVPQRLKQREDLPTVLSILDCLSKVLYAYLPEHKTYMDMETVRSLQSEGIVNRLYPK